MSTRGQHGFSRAEDTFTRDFCIIRMTPPVYCPEGDFLIYSEGHISYQSKQDFEKFHDALPDEESSLRSMASS
ncbi:hypothetical protein [Exiguobacterium sp. RIT594]|uniref:hypothetical protein n=1 Tax=Exiguobacterium sp. RIT594 TaxID=2282449 RepID=UPI0011C07EA8|nr:hypothetical protein [Exiguobacterium sp. RIT594]